VASGLGGQGQCGATPPAWVTADRVVREAAPGAASLPPPMRRARYPILGAGHGENALDIVRVTTRPGVFRRGKQGWSALGVALAGELGRRPSSINHPGRGPRRIPPRSARSARPSRSGCSARSGRRCPAGFCVITATARPPGPGRRSSSAGRPRPIRCRVTPGDQRVHGVAGGRSRAPAGRGPPERLLHLLNDLVGAVGRPQVSAGQAVPEVVGPGPWPQLDSPSRFRVPGSGVTAASATRVRRIPRTRAGLGGIRVLVGGSAGPATSICGAPAVRGSRSFRSSRTGGGISLSS